NKKSCKHVGSDEPLTGCWKKAANMSALTGCWKKAANMSALTKTSKERAKSFLIHNPCRFTQISR
ncbi:hypothetical protein QUF72_17025, partial [Desulfobacterales bacterium HSG2]|nr:hypothetical protein [Desulfobacterales bacterium HSG2]